MSETQDLKPESPSARPAAKLGAQLRETRQGLGWELPELASGLRIRKEYLEAIEDGRMSDLPGTTYALGFVRVYASALGLSGDAVAARFRAETDEVSRKPTLSFPAPVPQRGVPAGALMLLGLLILAGAYAGWYWVSDRRHTLVETVPPIPDRLAPPSAEKTPPSPQVASILPSATPSAESPAAAVPPPPKPAAAPPAAAPPASAAQIPPAPPVAAPAAGAAVTPQPPAAGAPAAAPTQTASPPAAPASPQPAGTRVVIKATADAWVTIKQKGGPAILNKLMHAGDSFPVPMNKQGLTLTTGNAGGTELDVDGTAVQGMGGSGMVRRDLPLDADTLKTGPLPPPGHPHPKPAVDTTTPEQ